MNEDCTIFMQGKPPCHAAESVKGFLFSRKIAALPWPSKCFDINPIKNGWSDLTQKVYERQNPMKKIFVEVSLGHPLIS